MLEYIKLSATNKHMDEGMTTRSGMDFINRIEARITITALKKTLKQLRYEAIFMKYYLEMSKSFNKPDILQRPTYSWEWGEYQRVLIIQ